ncbi:MAG: DNA polymerase IV [Alphaproteobacteria bacterium]|nr:DNA polymerase IV [Alphaproteobacteria bacterium]MCB9797363.1 DNA polymerase IV [Alphaproteobacteria bacterium]
MKILHVDMDAFYASVEQRDDPSLRGRPVVVGGSPEGRGVVAAASYEARRFGVHSAMPAARAKRLCPQLVFVRPDLERYKAVSRQVFNILRGYAEAIEPLSIDEAFLDVSHHVSATWVARELRAQIREALHLTASAGAAPSKMVAKIASGFRKPDGLTVVAPHQVRGFLAPLAVDRLWGVGPVTAARLRERGLETLGQLAALDDPEALRRLGPHGPSWARLARGEDHRPVRVHHERKSRSSERTFDEDLLDLEVLDASLVRQAGRVCEGLVRSGERGRTVTLKLRYADFTTLTRSTSLEAPTADPELVLRLARRLLSRTEAGRRPVRLLGVGVGSLETPKQLSLGWVA